MKEVKIMLNGKETTVKLKEIMLGERDKALEQSLKTRIQNGQTVAELNPMRFRKFILLYSIVEPSELKTIERIEQLPVAVADKLMAEAEQINTFSADLKKKSDGQ